MLTGRGASKEDCLEVINTFVAVIYYYFYLSMFFYQVHCKFKSLVQLKSFQIVSTNIC